MPFESLRDIYAVAFPSLVNAGITGLHEQMDVVMGFSRALQGEHITGQRALKDMIDELNGNGERTVFGKLLDQLGLTKQAMTAAASNGTEAQLIMKTLSAQTEAAGLRAESYEGQMNSLGDTLNRLKGKLADPVFEKLGPLLSGGKGTLGSAQAEGAASGTGNFAAGLMEDLAHRWAQVTEENAHHQAGMVPRPAGPGQPTRRNRRRAQSGKSRPAQERGPVLLGDR